MPGKELVDYIVNELNSGYSAPQLRQYLISQGYSVKDVDPAIRTAESILIRPPVQQFSESINDIVQHYVEQGQDVNIIRNRLLAQGYNSVDIDGALGVKQETKRKINIMPIAVIVMFIAFVSFGGFVLFKIKGIEDPEVKPWMQLDVESELLSKHPEPGKKAIFTVKASNLGTLKGYDIRFTYLLTEVKTRKVILFEEEDKAIQTTLSFVKDFDLPTYVKPGNYLFEVKATYVNTTAKSSLAFRIYSDSTEQDEPECTVNSDCENDEKCDKGLCILREDFDCREDRDCELGELCSGGQCTTTEDQPECFFNSDCEDKEECKNGLCTSLMPDGAECLVNSDCGTNQVCQNLQCISVENLANVSLEDMSATDVKLLIIKSAENDPAKAKDICNQYKGDYIGNLCFIYLSEAANNPEYCEYIEDVDSKERCFASFLYHNNDFSVCDRLTKPQNINFCEMAKRLSLLSQFGNLSGEVPTQVIDYQQESEEEEEPVVYQGS